MPLDSFAPFEETLANAEATLLGRRCAAGHWEGELSASALSTATAVFALSVYARACGGGSDTRTEKPIAEGVTWLVRHQNQDGGWGDTTLSRSNISTTCLCWAALAGHEHHLADAAAAIRRAEDWLTREAGSLEPAVLAQAIAARYGRDRTFSVPILTMCALAGRLGAGRDAWRHVPGLPFELAALPHAWFSRIRLPVVSYALPALIAIGQAIFHHHPPINPAARAVRHLTRARTLAVLESIQPEGGGFLEATPLTSFVTMSLASSGHADHPVVEQGVEFLLRSVRPDGSWPIDTNLATWLTTLSINALAAGGGSGATVEALLGDAEPDRLRRWLLAQQFREEHPYTHAAPGGWAWTDQPGGVPDTDDTAGALLALHHLCDADAATVAAAQAGVEWLLGLQNADGGMPTFCRGWGALPFDRSGSDLTAHALTAWTAWLPRLAPRTAERTRAAIRRAVEYLARTQRADGAWTPLWFGNQWVSDEENPVYGTARVVSALRLLPDAAHPRLASMRTRGIAWLANAQNDDGGWGGSFGIPSSIEETGLVLTALANTTMSGEDGSASSDALISYLWRGARWLREQTADGRTFAPSPIGFYFARLWYFEREYPVIYCVTGLRALQRRWPHG